jgi:hypothetical protein
MAAAPQDCAFAIGSCVARPRRRMGPHLRRMGLRLRCRPLLLRRCNVRGSTARNHTVRMPLRGGHPRGLVGAAAAPLRIVLRPAGQEGHRCCCAVMHRAQQPSASRSAAWLLRRMTGSWSGRGGHPRELGARHPPGKKAQRRKCEGNGTILCGHHEGHKGPTTQMLESDDDVQRWRWAAMRRVQKPNAVRSAAWGYAIAAWGYAYTAWVHGATPSLPAAAATPHCDALGPMPNALRSCCAAWLRLRRWLLPLRCACAAA